MRLIASKKVVKKEFIPDYLPDHTPQGYSKTYHSLDEMPAEIRALMESEHQELKHSWQGNRHSLDETSGSGKQSIAGMDGFWGETNTKESYAINGRIYHSLEDMPEEDRALAEQFFGSRDDPSESVSRNVVYPSAESEINERSQNHQIVETVSTSRPSTGRSAYPNPKVPSAGIFTLKNMIMFLLFLLLFYRIAYRFGWLG